MLTGTPIRREFLKRLGGLALARLGGLAGLGGEVAEAKTKLSNPVGYATISWPEKEFTQALETISTLGFKGVQMLGWVRDAYSGEKFSDLQGELSKLHLDPVALSCSRVKLNPAQDIDQTAEFQAYVNFFKRLGGKYLQVTDGGRPNVDYSVEQIKSLTSRMNQLGKLAREAGLTLGYHPHFGTLGETREGLGRVLDATDPGNVKLIADVAHLTLGGADPAEVIRTYHGRFIFCHFKDVRKDVADLARKDRNSVRKTKYHFCEIGTGVVNFPAVLQAFRSGKFRGWVIVELDGYEEPPGGPSESARKNQEGMRRLGFL